jgi:hypothetical protein
VETGKQEIMIENEVFKALFTHANEGILIVSEGKLTGRTTVPISYLDMNWVSLAESPLNF